MPTSSINYEGQLRTTCRHLQSGTEILTDAPTDNHGRGEAFSPTDLVATALGACMVSIMGIAGNQHGIDIEGTTAEVTKTMAANPRRISKIEVTLTMPAKQYTEKEKILLENAAKTCPVAKSLHPDIESVILFIWQSEI